LPHRDCPEPGKHKTYSEKWMKILKADFPPSPLLSKGEQNNTRKTTLNSLLEIDILLLLEDINSKGEIAMNKFKSLAAEASQSMTFWE
jgi:hypothetical protein